MNPSHSKELEEINKWTWLHYSSRGLKFNQREEERGRREREMEGGSGERR